MLDEEIIKKLLKEKKEIRQNEKSDAILIGVLILLGTALGAFGVAIFAGWIVLP